MCRRGSVGFTRPRSQLPTLAAANLALIQVHILLRGARALPCISSAIAALFNVAADVAGRVVRCPARRSRSMHAKANSILHR
ncbi:hypothetical protein PF008_g23610 [Phytophthora fragariae]|uniref:Uncharacterized protein n=1 Tax=Phytophthora fragariae TaxID=53985 RepID=A0A6G0QRA6_9STRA|nr:hypothetical protein PF008_g23610 [Phytophthora fragariae]